MIILLVAGAGPVVGAGSVIAILLVLGTVMGAGVVDRTLLVAGECPGAGADVVTITLLVAEAGSVVDTRVGAGTLGIVVETVCVVI